jgi:hypothetical protein
MHSITTLISRVATAQRMMNRLYLWAIVANSETKFAVVEGVVPRAATSQISRGRIY